jgi:hypothetical protein
MVQPFRNGFSNSNRARMGSNANTDRNQGGGPSKAGLPYQVGRDSWSSIAINDCHPDISGNKCTTLKCLQFTVNPNVRELRPVFVRPNIHMR